MLLNTGKLHSVIFYDFVSLPYQFLGDPYSSVATTLGSLFLSLSLSPSPSLWLQLLDSNLKLSPVDKICVFLDRTFQPFKLQHLYGGCMQCVCYVHMDYYKLLVCRMICPRWYRHAGPQLQLLKVSTDNYYISTVISHSCRSLRI